MSKPLFKATAEGLPANNRRYEIAYPRDTSIIKRMTTQDIIALFDALGASLDALNGVFNQPRCGENSLLAEWLETEIDRVEALRSYAMVEIERRPAQGGRWDEERIRHIAAYELAVAGAGILETLEKIVRLQRESEHASRHTANAA